jgi:hypothetical protein
MPEELLPPHAVIKLREAIINNFFINISDCICYYLQQLFKVTQIVAEFFIE